jgi:outer membrane protein
VQKISIALNAVLLVAVGVLFYMVFSMKKQFVGADGSDTLSVATVPLPKAEGKTMYINIDTLEAKYSYFLKIKGQLEKMGKANEAEIAGLYGNYQNTVQKYQQQMEAQTMTQEEYQEAQIKVAQMQESMRQREEKIAENYSKEAERLNNQFLKNIEAFLKKKSKEHNYSYVLAYTKGANLLYVNDSLDITSQVVQGLNAEYAVTQKK